MSFPTLPSPTHNLSLEEVLQRLAKHQAVEGILLIGSTAKANISEYSDYDLVLFLREMPVLLRVAVSTIDRRLTDVIFFSDGVLDNILQRDEPFQPHDREAPLVHWLSTGRIAFDRSGRVRWAQARLQTGTWLEELSRSTDYAYWQKVNYNVLQARRMLGAEDPVYSLALNLRLLYSLYEVWLAYLHLRSIPWEGDKPAIKRLMEEDPAFLALLQEAMNESSLGQKVTLYETLADQALAPLDGLWEEGTTAIRLQKAENETPENLRTALAFWEELVAAYSDS